MTRAEDNPIGIDLWDGWSLELPSTFATGRDPDGSWSAWSDEWVVDVKTISTAGRADGSTLSAAEMLGGEGEFEHTLSDGIRRGHARASEELDDRGQRTAWLHAEVAVPNKVIFCSIGRLARETPDPADLAFALSIWRSIRNSDERS